MTLAEYARKLRPLIEKAAQSLSEEDALQAVALYPQWTPGEQYAMSTRVRYEDVLYTVLQSHIAQTTWRPDSTPSLFAKVLIPDENVIPEWEQPDSTNAYQIGDKVQYNGKIWENTVANNVWQPGVYGWQEVDF